MTARNPIVVSNRDWQDLIGIQFALGGSNPQTGLNCYGLVREVYRGLQIELPEHQETALDADTAVEAAGNDWSLLEQPEPLAVALIRSEGNASMFHLAIVTPELTLLHALPKKGVIVSPVEAYQPRIIGFYHYTPGEGERLPLADGTAGRVIGSLAILALAIATPGLAAPYIGTFWGAMAGAAVSIGGNLLLNLIAPIKPESNALSGYTGDLADSRSYTWDGIQNDARQGLPKAMIFGVIRVGGQIISERTWFDASNNEYLDMLLCPAVGRITRLENTQLNDTDVDYYKNTAAEYRLGDDQQSPIDFFNRIYLQYSSGAKIPYDASADNPTDAVQFSTKSALTGISIIVTAPNGLYEIPASTPIARNVNFNVQYQPVVDGVAGDWAALPSAVTGDAKLFLRRYNGTFTGSLNPRSLADTGAGFVSVITAGSNFELSQGSTTWYCTQIGTLTADAIGFNAFTDEGRTTPATSFASNGAYDITDETVKLYPDGVGYKNSKAGSWRSYCGFETQIPINAASCTFTLETTNTTTLIIYVFYRIAGLTNSWVEHERVVFGNGTSQIGTVTFDVDITGLTLGYYQIAAFLKDPVTGITYEMFSVSDIVIGESTLDATFTLFGDTAKPAHIVSKQIELLNRPESYYNFRLWRTTADHTEATWQDDIYLRGYAEIIDKELAYPGHALVGIRSMATDRLSNSRPKTATLATGAPLTVPAAGVRYSTTCTSDDGIVDTDTLVNGLSVLGMRQITIPIGLGSYAGDGHLWMVRMDSAGFAQEDRLLTKFYLRVENWAEVDVTATTLYLSTTEEIPATTPLMIFNEAADPYISRHTAWATAKMLIDGSHGRITESSIDWTAFAAWDAWNMEIKNGQPRHLFDAIIDFNTDLWSLAMKAAQTARGNLYKKGNKYSVWIDKAATHVQVFGEGNSRNVTVNPIPRSDRANILTTSFLNAAANYEQKDISRDDVQGNEFPITKNIPLQVGVTRESQASDALDFMLLQNRYIGSMCGLEAGIDSVETTVGTVFMLASQAKDFSLSGRLVTVWAGVSVTLDQPFTPEVGITYQLTVWATDGTLYTWTGTLTGTDITTITAPAGLPESDYYEYPYVLCKLTEERMKYRCIGINREPDTMHATITGIEYRDECYIND